MFGRKLAVLIAQVLPQGHEPLCRIDELNLALPVSWLSVREDPDIGRNPCVVEDTERQGDDGFKPVVFDDPPADFTFARAGITREKRTAIVYLGDAGTQRRIVLHLRKLVGQEHHLAIAGARDQAVSRIVAVWEYKAWVREVPLSANALKIILPALTVGGVGKHEVEAPRRESIVSECRSVTDLFGGAAFALQKQVGLSDGGARADQGAAARFLRRRVMRDRRSKGPRSAPFAPRV